MEDDMYKDIRKKLIRERWRSHRGGYWTREKGSWRYKFERGNCKLNLTGEISSSAGWQMKSLVRISEFKNGKEKKRNPRKERSRRKCLIHSMEVHGKDKESTSLCHFWRRRVPMWIFLTGFDDESRESLSLDGRRTNLSWFKNGEERKRNPRKETERNAISGGGAYLCELSSLVFSRGVKILRKMNGIPGRKQSNLANFSATEEECTLKAFLSIFGSRCFKRREENARQDNQNEENLANFLSEWISSGASSNLV